MKTQKITLYIYFLQDMDSSNDVKFFRLTTKKYEIMVSPDNQYVLLVFHQAHDERWICISQLFKKNKVIESN